MVEVIHRFNVFERRELPPSVWKFRAGQKPWDRWAEEKGPQGQIHRRQRELTLGQVRSMHGGLMVLDAGCGTGKMAYEMANAPNVNRVIAIDINPSALKIAGQKMRRCRGRDKVDLVKNKLDDISFPEAFFDAVVCIDVLSELADVPQSLARIHAWLKPGGILIGNFVAEEVFIKYAIERHGIIKRKLLAFRHYLGIAFSLSSLTYPAYEYFGEKGYTRLMPYRENEVRAALDPHFNILQKESGFYHWFAAQRKAPSKWKQGLF